VQWAERIMRKIDNVFSAEGQFTVAPPQHLLYFLPEPQGQGSFRPTLGSGAPWDVGSNHGDAGVTSSNEDVSRIALCKVR
jgi:hypothetical protein